MKKIENGDSLMLFTNLTNASSGKTTPAPLAYATGHTFTMTGNTISTGSKDHGAYDATEVGSISWEITTENLYTTEDYERLSDLMLTREPVDVIWGTAASNNPNYETEGVDNTTHSNAITGNNDWFVNTKVAYKKGKAVITSLVANANHGEKATYSATFSGAGAIQKVAANVSNNITETTFA